MDIVTVVQFSLLGFAVILLLILVMKKGSGESKSQVESELKEIFPEILKNANEQLISMANEKLSAEKKEISSDLSNKKMMIEDMVKRVLQDLNDSNRRLEKAERDRIGSFESIKTEMENQKKLTEQLSATTEGLKKVLSNNQLRGQFGEQVAEDLLKMAGFVRGTDYEFNKEQKGSETRPDFAIFLPDSTRINVDSKFPYNNLQRYIESEDKESKVKYLKDFTRDIKEKVKQVTTRDYINPKDKTVDFVILFIPNEMIFSFIYDKMNDTWVEAMKNKVVFAGPFSFTAILRMVRQAYDNFKYQENAQKIIGYIKTFEEEFRKYNEEFVKIGSKIDQLSRQYESVEGTRTRQLLRSVDKIRLEEPAEAETLSLPEMSSD